MQKYKKKRKKETLEAIIFSAPDIALQK